MAAGPNGLHLYRVFGPNSAGGLVSGAVAIENATPYTMTPLERQQEFSQHRRKDDRIPTRLVSATNNFFRALAHIIRLLKDSNNDPCQVVLAFLFVPTGSAPGPHRARDLVHSAEDKSLMASEFVFDWQIDPRYVTHQVSAATLLQRGLEEHLPWLHLSDSETEPIRTTQLRVESRHFFGPGYYEVDCSPYAEAFDAGLKACSVALLFGFRGPYSIICKALLCGTWPKCYRRALEEGVDFVVENTFCDRDFVERLVQYSRDQGEMEHNALVSANELFMEGADYASANTYYDARIAAAQQMIEHEMVAAGF